MGLQLQFLRLLLKILKEEKWGIDLPLKGSFSGPCIYSVCCLGESNANKMSAVQFLCADTAQCYQRRRFFRSHRNHFANAETKK